MICDIQDHEAVTAHNAHREDGPDQDRENDERRISARRVDLDGSV